MIKILNLILSLILILLLNACKTKNESTLASDQINTYSIDGSLVILKTKTDSLHFDIEIADTPEKSALGLMYRKTMDDNQAMLFIFDYEKEQSFWMKNTYLPLDIIFIDHNKKIVNIIKNAIPLNEELLPSEIPASYALEIKAGLSDKLGIKKGMSINYSLSK